MKDRKRRNLLIGLLGVMLVFVGLGYAVLSSTLTITSTSNVAGSWNVQLTSISKASSTGSAISNSTSINSDGLGGTVSNTFTAPGESITYDVKVENKGKIDAIVNIDLPEDDDYYLFSTTFVEDTSLKSNNEYTFQITITYDEDAIDAPSGTSNHTFNITVEQDENSGTGGGSQSTTETESTTNYTGYYADTNNDGTPDGVIFVDLLKSANDNDETVDGQWNDSNGDYSYTTIESTKAYEISDTNYTGSFGTKPIISIKQSSTGNDRFYVMALEDADSNWHYWYKNAYGNMSDYATTTSNDFGKGRSNTYTMINKWNNEAYGTKTTTGTDADMWGIIQTQTKYPITTNGITEWFVPSQQEWSVFGDTFGIYGRYEEDDGEGGSSWVDGNYANFGLEWYYWSSSQRNVYSAWHAYFDCRCMEGNSVGYHDYVRLATTF